MFKTVPALKTVRGCSRWINISMVTCSFQTSSSSCARADQVDNYELHSDWCCILEGGFPSPCSTCPLPEAATEYLKSNYKASSSWKDNFRKSRNSRRPVFNVKLSFNQEHEFRCILGLEEEEKLSAKVIKKAFRVAALDLHPDKANGYVRGENVYIWLPP
uniref:J domain-containing protein n=1 Tax=Aplanochytrium stocchinoi TaxID=215587 RepID=A0A6S7ZNW9_9STRA